LGIKETNYKFNGQTSFYRGKVRDVYRLDDIFISIATDRISAFDHVLPKAIPFKGQVLNQLAVYFLDATKDIVPNWLIASPDPNVSIGLNCEPIKIEMVIRGYLVGHAWREYKSGKRVICGVPLADGLKENEKFQKPIITPATKAEEGHDEDISREDIIRKGIVSEEIYIQIEKYTIELFQKGQELAAERGLILVDTKYEFGIYQDRVYLIDEIHTPDSSRYFYSNRYKELFDQNLPQEQLSKEFVREWLMANGFQGKDGDIMPTMEDSFVETVTNKYIHLYELLTGNKFIKPKSKNVIERIYENINDYIGSLKRS
jgi:phosphoribosylaminoimidazole-succinocarboxamide synthase